MDDLQMTVTKNFNDSLIHVSRVQIELQLHFYMAVTT
jgi:hypothetical protein